MPCYRPITAYKGSGGAITFHEGGNSGPPIQLPCGRCIGCRLKRTGDWAMRCMHESQMHPVSSFVTLTFDEAHYKPSLDYQDFRLFMRRLRRTKGPCRFFAAGEYGTENQRPHWHALLFGCAFAAQQRIGERLWRSPELEALWTQGFSSIGEVTWESAAYVASYAIKKITGPLAATHYSRVDLFTGEIIQVEPETAQMSRRPGIGASWLNKYWPEVYNARDGVVRHGGRETPPPRYYDKKMSETHETLMTNKETQRQLNALERREDNTPERLATREAVAKANLKRKNQQRKL